MSPLVFAILKVRTPVDIGTMLIDERIERFTAGAARWRNEPSYRYGVAIYLPSQPVSQAETVLRRFGCATRFSLTSRVMRARRIGAL